MGVSRENLILAMLMVVAGGALHQYRAFAQDPVRPDARPDVRAGASLADSQQVTQQVENAEAEVSGQMRQIIRDQDDTPYGISRLDGKSHILPTHRRALDINFELGWVWLDDVGRLSLDRKTAAMGRFSVGLLGFERGWFWGLDPVAEILPAYDFMAGALAHITELKEGWYVQATVTHGVAGTAKNTTAFSISAGKTLLGIEYLRWTGDPRASNCENCWLVKLRLPLGALEYASRPEH